jgi:ATP-dependent Clp protease ATP-binding subunit ClpC
VLGARPLRRTIQREIEDNLSERILFNELRPGQIIVVDCEGDPTDIEHSQLVFRGAEKPALVPDAVPSAGDRRSSQTQRETRPEPNGR